MEIITWRAYFYLIRYKPDGLEGKFFGTIARNVKITSLNCKSWKQIPNLFKKEMVQAVEVLITFNLAITHIQLLVHILFIDVHNIFCMQSLIILILQIWLSGYYNRSKSDLKAIHYNNSKSILYHLSNISQRVNEDQ